VLTTRRYLLSIVFILLLISSIFSQIGSSGFIERRTIKIAFIWQKWDTLDFIAPINMKIYKHILKEAEKRYHVKFKIYEFWDNWRSGDIQNGKLRKLGIDVVVGPGGIGGWNSPREYRLEIKKFVREGGGFYGICGDSTFGSLGVIHLPLGYKIPLKRIIGSWSFTPMLGLANVYTDASVFRHLVKHPLFFGKLDFLRIVKKLPLSRAAIRIKRSLLRIQEPYEGDRVRVMLGNAPLVDGPWLFRLFMPRVFDVAVFVGSDKPYDKSIRGKKAIVASTYGFGRVVLSVVHPELTIGNKKAHDIFVRNILWLAKALPTV